MSFKDDWSNCTSYFINVVKQQFEFIHDLHTVDSLFYAFI